MHELVARLRLLFSKFGAVHAPGALRTSSQTAGSQGLLFGVARVSIPLCAVAHNPTKIQVIITTPARAVCFVLIAQRPRGAWGALCVAGGGIAHRVSGTPITRPAKRTGVASCAVFAIGRVLVRLLAGGTAGAQPTGWAE